MITLNSIIFCGLILVQPTLEKFLYSPFQSSQSRLFLCSKKKKDKLARLVISTVEGIHSFKGQKVNQAWNASWIVDGKLIDDTPEEFYSMEGRIVWVDGKVAWDANGEVVSCSDLFKSPHFMQCIDKGSNWNFKDKNFGEWRKYKIILNVSITIQIVLVKNGGIVSREDFYNGSPTPNVVYSLREP